MNDLNDRVQRIFCCLLKADNVDWSVSIHHDHLRHMNGVSYQMISAGGELRVTANIRVEFDDYMGTNSLTRLQAKRVKSGSLMSWDTHAQLVDGRFVVSFAFRFAPDFESFLKEMEELVLSEYDYEFTKAFESELSSHN